MCPAVFAAVFVGGQAGQSIVLPLWLDAVPGGLDPYFLLLFTALTFFVFYGIVLFVRMGQGAIQRRQCCSWNSKSAILAGVCVAANGTGPLNSTVHLEEGP